MQPKGAGHQDRPLSAGATLSVRLGDGLSLGFSGLYHRSRSTAPTGLRHVPTIRSGPGDPAKLDLLSTQKGDDQAFAWNGGFR